MSFCHNFLSFVPCGKSSTVQPLVTQDTREIIKEKKEDANKLNPTAPLRIPTKAASDSVRCEEDGTDGLIRGEKMVDIRSSSMIKPCLIGSPPPSVLRERSKFRRDRLTQSRLATDNNSQPAEETVLQSTGETPAIHLSCSVDDMDGPDDMDDNMEIVALNPGVSIPERLTPPPRIDQVHALATPSINPTNP